MARRERDKGPRRRPDGKGSAPSGRPGGAAPIPTARGASTVYIFDGGGPPAATDPLGVNISFVYDPATAPPEQGKGPAKGSGPERA